MCVRDVRKPQCSLCVCVWGGGCLLACVRDVRKLQYSLYVRGGCLLV